MGLEKLAALEMSNSLLLVNPLPSSKESLGVAKDARDVLGFPLNQLGYCLGQLWLSFPYQLRGCSRLCTFGGEDSVQTDKLPFDQAINHDFYSLTAEFLISEFLIIISDNFSLTSHQEGVPHF